MRSLLTCSLFCFSSIFIISIHSRRSIQFDGVISEGEWTGAEKYGLAGGGNLLWKKENTTLYVALIGDKKSWAHFYITSGDTVRVLHASAALGEAKYVKEKEIWRPIQVFSWQLRDRVYSDRTRRKMEDHYSAYGWVANNNNLGSGTTIEAKIDLSKGGKAPWPFACLIASDTNRLLYFPASLTDHTLFTRLVQGYIPDSLRFSPQTWMQIR